MSEFIEKIEWFSIKVIIRKITMSEESFALTRYLYSFIEVRQSLMMALLDRQRDEALFWLYELYFSEGEAFEYVIQLYNYLYKQYNPVLEAFINKLFAEWEDDDE
jgi:hypothetical protein